MQSFKQLPANARRALARRELQRRAGRAGANDDPELAALREQLEVAIPALIQGAGGRVDAVHRLRHRLMTGTATEDDHRLLVSVPEGTMTAAEILDLLHETELKLFGLEPDSAEAKALLG
ncbi:MAG: hypothetical protein IPH51_02170 [Rubrivivax sp.]|nr:hypothetical protein [Rubrivivax sp.]